MDTRILKHTTLEVSRVCCGTMTFGAQVDEASAIAMVRHCLDHGVNFFDTANMYTGGASEIILGKALQGRRDDVVLASKCGAKLGDLAGLSRAAILRAAEDSLRRLQTDYLDLYYLHIPDYQVPIDESLGAMQELVRAGKVRHVAASNYASWQICRMHWLAETRSLPRIGTTQPMYNLIARGIEAEFLPMCRELGVSTFVYNPLAGGMLTGKQPPAAPLPGTRFDGNQAYLDRYWHDATFAAVHTLAEIARQAGRSLMSLAFNWLLHHTSIDGVIVGASRRAQLEENLRAGSEGPLPADAVAACDRVWAKLRGPVPNYNR